MNAIYRLYLGVYRVYLVARQYIDVPRQNIDVRAQYIDVRAHIIISRVGDSIKASPAPPWLLGRSQYIIALPVAPRSLNSMRASPQ